MNRIKSLAYLALMMVLILFFPAFVYSVSTVDFEPNVGFVVIGGVALVGCFYGLYGAGYYIKTLFSGEYPENILQI